MAGGAPAGKWRACNAGPSPHLIAVKGSPAAPAHAHAVILTFELYLDTGEGAPQFWALTCERSELLAQAQAALEDAGAKSVEVRRHGCSLFTLEAEP